MIRPRASLAALVAWLLFLLACAAIISRTTFTTDLSAFLPSSPTAEQQLLMDQLEDGLASRLILVGLEGGDAATRAALSKQMAQRLRGDARFVSVNNGERINAERDRAFLFDHRYLLSPFVTPERFGVDGLAAALGDSIDLLASPAGLIVKSMLPRDPTGEFMHLLDTLDSGTQPNVVEGVWASRDGARALLVLQTRADGGDTDAQQAAMTAIRDAFAKAPAATAAVRLEMSGPGVFSVTSRDTIKRQVTQLSLVSLGLIAALLLLVYRSVTALALGLLPVLSGALAGIAAVSLGFGSVHGITLGFGTALIGEAVDYSIYLFVQSEHSRTERETWIRRYWPTIRLGVLTSIAGFASLLFSGFPGLAQLGLYAIAGLVVAALVTRFVLPSLLPAGFRVHDVSAIGRTLSRLVERAARLRWAAVAVLVAASAVVVVQRDHLWNDRIASLSPVSEADVDLDARLRADLGAPDVRYIVTVAGPSREAVLGAAERAAAVLQTQVERGELAGYESPSRYLPSAATQRARQQSLPERASLDARLSEAVEDLPVRAERFAPFLDDVDAARAAPFIDAGDLAGTSMAMAVDALLLQKQGTWRALLPLTGPAGQDIDAATIRAALKPLPEALFVDMKAESDRLYAGYLHEAIALSLGGLVVIVGLLLAVFRSVRRTARVIVPLAAAVVTVTAGLSLAGQQLIILHLVGLLLVVAVGSNYALFFDRADPAAPIAPRTLASMLFANLTTVIGFGLLAFSDVAILQALGVTVAPGVVLALLYSAIFARAGRG